MKQSGFSIVEIIIVITILGILAAAVSLGFQNHTAKAKESAVKSNLKAFRSQLEIYKVQHRGIPPGYVGFADAPIEMVELQLTTTSSAAGAVSSSTIPADPYLYGPYLKKIPENPYNDLSTIAYVNGADFSSAADGTSSGWLYSRDTGEIRVNWVGNDTGGMALYRY
jgi:general secretion pathway protein G